jgi:hypothetical protein
MTPAPQATPRTDALLAEMNADVERIDGDRALLELATRHSGRWVAHARSLERALSAAEARVKEMERDAARLRELEQANTDLADESERLREGLRFYAHGMHYEGFGTWEGPSGDDNWLCPPTRDSSDYREFIDDLDQHMIEDGAVARCYLSGKRADWEGEEPPEHPCEPVMKAIAEAEAEDRAALAGKQEEGR